MLRFTGKHCRKVDAYSLAEVLIVMSIIVLIISALPPMTKKVFKIKEVMKMHGRYECFWRTNASGEKHLYSYVYEENGHSEEIDLTNKYGAERDYCEFTPGANTVYFTVHAVGGGGAGATIAGKYADLKGKNDIQSEYELLSSNIALFPKWISWIKDTQACNKIPWCNVSDDKWDISFDVNSIATKQYVGYSLGGTSGGLATMFMPSLPSDIKLRIKPGKGGVLKRTNDSGEGTPGEASTVYFVYSDGTEIESLVAQGGLAGKGDLNVGISEELVGGVGSDFGLTTKAAIKTRKSNFGDLIENIEDLDGNRESHVPDGAGDSGNGETQFVSNTDGNLYFEFVNNDGSIPSTPKRINQQWTSLVNLITLNYFSKENFNTTPNCSIETNATSFVMTRNGYCAYSGKNSEDKYEIYKCVIGKVPESVLQDIKNNAYYCGTYIDGCYSFTVYYNYESNNSSVSPYYTSYTTYNPYYSCEFDNNYSSFKCKTRLTEKRFSCTKQTGGLCSDGAEPMYSTSGTTYEKTGTEVNKLKCPAHEGKDGAVVILW